ncbi:acyl-CoA carboxylase subunit epsilon [Streptomyces sp. NPDC004435]|uniref:acyl-CoA carboxylase subunit epsilon n=1 Tax=Streptomyces sp. NPDC004435 TaxID=3364701 RepID=UPI0036C0B72C
MTLPDLTADNFLRIERGSADPEELAALVAVLFSRMTGPEEPDGTSAGRPVARWQRLERAPGHHTPRSWRASAAKAQAAAHRGRHE